MKHHGIVGQTNISKGATLYPKDTNANVAMTQPMFFSPICTPQNWKIKNKTPVAATLYPSVELPVAKTRIGQFEGTGGRVFSKTMGEIPKKDRRPFKNALTDAEKENIIVEALTTPKGRKALSQSLKEPIRNQLEYSTVGRKLIMINDIIKYKRDPASVAHVVARRGAVPNVIRRYSSEIETGGPVKLKAPKMNLHHVATEVADVRKELEKVCRDPNLTITSSYTISHSASRYYELNGSKSVNQ